MSNDIGTQDPRIAKGLYGDIGFEYSRYGSRGFYGLLCAFFCRRLQESPLIFVVVDFALFAHPLYWAHPPVYIFAIFVIQRRSDYSLPSGMDLPFDLTTRCLVIITVCLEALPFPTSE